jgi:hypothetical protein
LWGSSSYLLKLQILILVISRLGLWKQNFNDVEEDEWSRVCSSTMLRSSWNSNCHVNASMSNNHDLAWILHTLLQQKLNKTCRWWIKQEQAEIMMNFDERKLKKFGKIWENLEVFGFGSEKMNCDPNFLLWLRLYSPVNPTP